MNNEIKEILNRLDYNEWEVALYKVPITWCELYNIRDYITNLQQENERLKETNVYCNRTDCIGRIKDSRKYDSVYQEKEDYKSRCEKAINFIEEMLYPIGSCVNGSDLPYESIESLLNILQIGSEEK